jgi:hypothetical protein
MNDLHKLYIALRHEKTETVFFHFRVSKGLSHGLIVCSVDIIIKMLRHEVRRIDIIRLT